MVINPNTIAMTPAGITKRQAEMPAARMAINSDRRFNPTKADKDPNKKAKGRRVKIVLGDFNIIRPRIAKVLISALPVNDFEISTKSMRKIIDEIMPTTIIVAVRQLMRT